MEESEATVLPELCRRETFFLSLVPFLLVSVAQHSQPPW